MASDRDWITTIDRHRLALEQLPPGLTLLRPRPGSWSCREILGHLVDSALNNLSRFVLAGNQADLVFPGYDQDAWVRAQLWNEADWPDLIRLWAALNRQLGRVTESLDPELRQRPRHPHSVYRIGWKTWPEEEPVSLEYLIQDYRGHLEHHLAALFRLASELENSRRGAAPGPA